MEGVCHILLNYLNQMQLVVLEAERSKDFDPKVLELSKDLTHRAKESLMKLDQIERVNEESIELAVYGENWSVRKD